MVCERLTTVIFNIFLFPFLNTDYICEKGSFKIKYRNDNIAYLLEVEFYYFFFVVVHYTFNF